MAMANISSRDKCLQAARGLLEEGDSVVIGMSRIKTRFFSTTLTVFLADNTNPDPDTRATWVDLAKKYKIPARCIWFKTPTQVCEHNDVVRALNKSVSDHRALLRPDQGKVADEWIDEPREAREPPQTGLQQL